jgi:SAM-dependent methyltransferase
MDMSRTIEARHLSGASLYGDDFDEVDIRRWYAEEDQGYYELVKTYGKYVYDYHALNEYQAYRFLRGHYECCLAMGCAKGDDVAPLADRVDRYVAIEPAEQWWSPEIGGRPASYLKPSILGDIPMAEASADLVVCLGVLHHIPNVSHVFSELVRVLRPGGKLVVREPISSMGDWRRPRPGLTRNERGLPPGWLESKAQANGLRIERANYCLFPLTARFARIIGLRSAYNNPLLVRFDALTSRLTQWNLHYYRNSLFKKLAPGAINLLCEKLAKQAES